MLHEMEMRESMAELEELCSMKGKMAELEQAKIRAEKELQEARKNLDMSQKQAVNLRDDFLREKNINASLRDSNNKLESDMKIIQLQYEHVDNANKDLEKLNRDLQGQLTSSKIELERKNQELRALGGEMLLITTGDKFIPELYEKYVEKFFQSPEWFDAQKDIMIDSGRELRDSILEAHPDMADKLQCIAWKVDQLTTAEKAKLRAEGKEVPATPSAIYSDEEDTVSDVRAGKPHQELEATLNPDQENAPDAEQIDPQNEDISSMPPVVENPNQDGKAAENNPQVSASEGVYSQCETIQQI